MCAVVSVLPIKAFAGGHQGLVEVRQGAGSLFDSLQVQSVAALQVLMGNGAQAISSRSAKTKWAKEHS